MNEEWNEAIEAAAKNCEKAASFYDNTKSWTKAVAVRDQADYIRALRREG